MALTYDLWGDMHYQFLQTCLQGCGQAAEGRGCGQVFLAAVGRTPLHPGSTGAVLALLIEVDPHRFHAGARAEPASGHWGDASCPWHLLPQPGATQQVAVGSGQGDHCPLRQTSP